VTLEVWLVNTIADARIAQFVVDGRGVMKLPCSKEQIAELAPLVGKKFVVTIAETGTLIPLATEDAS